MSKLVDEKFQVSPFLVFFLIHGFQIGVGILAFQRLVAKYAEQDSWIPLFLASFAIHIVIWFCYKMLSEEQPDIIAVHQFLFGKWISKLLDFAFLVYIFLICLTVFRTYIEVLQLWMFPLLPTWVLSLVIIAITYYILTSGFRIVAGVAFFSVILPSFLWVMLIFPLQFANYRNLLPVWDHSVQDILMASKVFMFEFSGFEPLLIFYPFIKKAHKSQKFAHGANALTFFTYFIILLVSLVYFNKDELQHTIYPTLSMAKIIEIPFIQRFEYIVISLWFLVIIPGISISTWCCARLCKRSFSLRPSRFLPFFFACLFAGALFFDTRYEINSLGKYSSFIGLFLFISYIPLLSILTMLKRKWRGMKKKQKEA